MYTLDRVQKAKIVTICLCILSFVISIICYAKGGDELIQHGFMNEPLASILMIACFICGLILLLLCCVIHAVQKDMAEHLKYLAELYKQ